VPLQYRAPSPCPRGYHYFFPFGPSDTDAHEYGLASCIRVVPEPATLDEARARCFHGGEPVSPFVIYSHLVTMSNVTGARTALTNFVQSLAVRAGLGAGPSLLLWTGALVSGAPGNSVNLWVDRRAFDSVVTLAAPPSAVRSADG
jgi:hypothetical protein